MNTTKNEFRNRCDHRAGPKKSQRPLEKDATRRPY